MVYVRDEPWECVVCGWTGNTAWFCAGCGRRQDVATDIERWDRFTLDAEVAADNTDVPDDARAG